MHTTLSERSYTLINIEVDISDDDDKTDAFTLPGRPIMGLLIPALNDTPTLTFQVSPDEGSTWYDLKDSDGSTAAISITGGATAFAVSADDLSPIAPYCVPGIQLRLALSASQTADRTFYVAAIA